MSAFDEAVITTDRLVLTPLRQADADAMVDVLGDEQLHEFIGGHPAGPADLRRRYEQLAAGPGRPGQIWLNWIVRRDVDHQPIGTVQTTVTRHGNAWAAEIAWVIGVRWQGAFLLEGAGDNCLSSRDAARILTASTTTKSSSRRNAPPDEGIDHTLRR